jgi:Asp-tRNA(Asn)/Glu-tRNA(Gln) amidotransferase A subunit family amidase
LVIAAVWSTGSAPAAVVPLEVDPVDQRPQLLPPAAAFGPAYAQPRAVLSETLEPGEFAQVFADDVRAVGSPSLNAIASINANAVSEADRLDRRFAEAGLSGPLHCVPVIVKDNIETEGWETAAGSLALKGFVPAHDATAIVRLKAAGAIILAKANMADLALNALTTVNRLHGPTKNPYALDRVPAGSSGGTAVAIAANFGLVGLHSYSRWTPEAVCRRRD